MDTDIIVQHAAREAQEGVGGWGGVNESLSVNEGQIWEKVAKV